MPGSSLARRFFLLSALWGALSLAVAGFVIVTVYRASVERAFDERLSVHLKTLVGAFAAQSEAGGGFRAPEGLAEPRFALPLSGWYWVVRATGDDHVVVASPSLTGEVLRLPSDTGARPDADRGLSAYVEGPDGQNLRVVERLVDFDGTRSWRIAVAGNAEIGRAHV